MYRYPHLPTIRTHFEIAAFTVDAASMLFVLPTAREKPMNTGRGQDPMNGQGIKTLLFGLTAGVFGAVLVLAGLVILVGFSVNLPNNDQGYFLSWLVGILVLAGICAAGAGLYVTYGVAYGGITLQENDAATQDERPPE